MQKHFMKIWVQSQQCSGYEGKYNMVDALCNSTHTHIFKSILRKLRNSGRSARLISYSIGGKKKKNVPYIFSQWWHLIITHCTALNHILTEIIHAKCKQEQVINQDCYYLSELACSIYMVKVRLDLNATQDESTVNLNLAQ